ELSVELERGAAERVADAGRLAVAARDAGARLAAERVDDVVAGVLDLDLERVDVAGVADEVEPALALGAVEALLEAADGRLPAAVAEVEVAAAAAAVVGVEDADARAGGADSARGGVE